VMRGTQFDRRGRKWLTEVGAPRQCAVGRKARRRQAGPMVEGAIGWVGERRGASGDLVQVCSGADPAGDVPSVVRCLPWWLEEGGDGDSANERSRRPSAWSENTAGFHWGSWRTRWRHTWPEVPSPRGGALAVAAETGSAQRLTTLRVGQGKRRQAASGLLHGDGLRRTKPNGEEASLTGTRAPQ
jgi:hypothetical protein